MITVSAPPNNLPTQLTSLVGREHETVDVCRLLLREDVRLLTLTGPPGIGKTRLAIYVAGSLHAHLPGGSYFVNLAPISDPKLVLPAIATALGLRQAANQPLADPLVGYLTGKHLLLLLDNFEQVLPAGLDIAHLLRVAPAFKVLVTSRELLHLSGERAFVVPPLSLPPEGSMGGAPGEPRPPSPEQLTRYEAVRLFVQRAGALKPDFMVDSENAPVVAEICRRLDGLPLAIELAAARVRHLPPAAILQRLQHRLHVLTGGAHDLPDRQRTLRATIEWSYALLDGPERRLFRRLAAFRGGHTLAAIEAVCNANQDLVIEPLAGVSSLMDKSLLYQVQGEGGGGEPRYMLLETIHEFAREELEASGEEPTVRRQHATYFAEMAERAEPRLKGPDQVEWLDRLEAEQDNFRAALEWAYHNDIALGMRLTAALGTFWSRRSYLSEGKERALAMLARAREQGVGRTAYAARSLCAVGLITFYQGDFALGRSVLSESVDIYRELGQGVDRSGLAESLDVLGSLIGQLVDIPAGRVLHEEALAIAREIGDTWGIARATVELGHTARIGGDYDQARRYFEQSLAIFRECGDRYNIGRTLLHLGLTANHQGDYASAEELLEQSLAIFRELGSTLEMAYTRYNLASAVQGLKDYARARAMHEENLARAAELGVKRGLPETVWKLGRIAYMQGDYARSHELHKRSLAQFKESGDNRGLAFCLMDTAGAVTAGTGASARFRPRRSKANRAQGPIPVQPEAPVVQAAQLLGAASALFTRLGCQLDRESQDLFTAYTDTARSALGAQEFADAWGRGQAMTGEEAVALAFAIDVLAAPREPELARSAGRGRKGSFGGLTQREREVAVLVAQGKSNREISAALVITEHTVEGHVSNLLAKLDFRSRSQISVWAVEHGLTAGPS